MTDDERRFSIPETASISGSSRRCCTVRAPNSEGFRQNMFQNLSLGIECLLDRWWGHRDVSNSDKGHLMFHNARPNCGILLPESPSAGRQPCCCDGLFCTKKVIHSSAGGVPLVASKTKMFRVILPYDSGINPEAPNATRRVIHLIFTSCSPIGMAAVLIKQVPHV
jgi:hypothetical protein